MRLLTNSVKDHHALLHYLPLLKKACVRQVALDKWLPPDVLGAVAANRRPQAQGDAGAAPEAPGGLDDHLRRRLNGYLAQWVHCPPGEHTSELQNHNGS